MIGGKIELNISGSKIRRIIGVRWRNYKKKKREEH
jgi:hypothetical protein